MGGRHEGGRTRMSGPRLVISQATKAEGGAPTVPPSTVGVWEPLEVCRDAVIAGLSEQGNRVIELTNLRDAVSSDVRAVFGYVDEQCLEEWRRLVTAHVCAVGLVDDRTALSPDTLLAAGFTAVLHRGVTADSVASAWRAVDAGYVVRPLLDEPALGVAEAVLNLSAEERSWLQAAADGTPVAEIAARCGHSERTLQPRLHAVCVALGARNLVHALVVVAAHGLIHPH